MTQHTILFNLLNLPHSLSLRPTPSLFLWCIQNSKLGFTTLTRPTDVPIVVPTLPVDATFPCCPGCEVLNEPVTELVPIEEEHPVSLPRDNQGQGARMAAVCSGQRACRGGHSDHQGYGGVARMQPSTVPRREYPDQCK